VSELFSDLPKTWIAPEGKIGFSSSKEARHHKAMIAMHYMHYNFWRIHKTLSVTPAMEAGKADHVWSLEEIAGLV